MTTATATQRQSKLPAPRFYTQEEVADLFRVTT
jgi:hypothetical protein